MNQLTQSKTTIILPVFTALMLACFALSSAPKAFGVRPAPDAGYPGQNAAAGDDPLFSINVPARGIIWSFASNLNTARWRHTATLLPNGMVLVAGGLPAVWPAPNCTTRRPVPGLPQAALTPHALLTRRPCCQTAWSWLQGDWTAIPLLPRARNCTTRRPGPGLPRPALMPHALLTRRPCCQTAWSWLLEDRRAKPSLRERGTVRPGERDLD